MKHCTVHLNKGVIRRCDACKDCVKDEYGQPICMVKKRLKLDSIGIHSAHDGTAIDCPKK